MSTNLRKHLPILAFLKVAPPKIRKIILKNCDNEVILSICEICQNIAQGNVNCSKKCREGLKKFKKSIHKLAVVKRKHKQLKKERDILNQSGGAAFLPLILAPVISGLTQYILERTFKKK